MNIDIEKATSDLASAAFNGQIADAAPSAVRELIRQILVKHQIHPELEDQMPERI